MCSGDGKVELCPREQLPPELVLHSGPRMSTMSHLRLLGEIIEIDDNGDVEQLLRCAETSIISRAPGIFSMHTACCVLIRI